ncbi:MAG: hypothetical protein HY286_20150 [Planctomycetes bacterium]|nr:hypothetical protein [Planctomycetota bacterium]
MHPSPNTRSGDRSACIIKDLFYSFSPRPRESLRPRNLARSALALLVVHASVAVLVGTAPAQQFQAAISTQGYGQNSAYPFGLNFGPDGQLYVCLAGTPTFGDPTFSNNNVVVRVNPNNNQITGSIQVELFPEEVAFATPPGGSPVGIVTNSTSGSVSIFDVATQQVIGTAALPGGFFGSFPFGIATNLNQSIAYISVGDGSNTLRAVDLDPSSATVYQHVPARDLQLTSGSAARIARLGSAIVAPCTSYTQTFTGALASFERMPLPGSFTSGTSTLLVLDDNVMKYPSAQDVAIAPDGTFYICGYDMQKRVYGFDATGKLIRSFPVPTIVGAHTGLAISPDGKTMVVCDVASDQIAFVDVARGLTTQILFTTAMGFGYSGPNDAVFSPDGLHVFITTQFSEDVLKLSAPPTPSAFTQPLGFTIDVTNPTPGTNVTLSTVGAGANELVFILADGYDVSYDLGPYGILHFTDNATIVGSATGGDLSVVVQAPIGFPAGSNFLCQAVSIDANTFAARLSDEIPVILQ